MDMGMKAIFVEDEMMEMVDGWYKDRNQDPPPRCLYPYTGFIVPGVAAGFLYETDSDVCILDGYISNPNTNEAERNEALDIVTSALLDMAKYRGFKQIIAFSQSGAIVARAKKYGFYDEGTHTLLVKEGL